MLNTLSTILYRPIYIYTHMYYIYTHIFKYIHINLTTLAKIALHLVVRPIWLLDMRMGICFPLFSGFYEVKYIAGGWNQAG